ncbi:hypothetical protein RCH09_002190 [Actimicrobium sp. GrIS 1.19]|uniref:hypothetical protein n=1 Tax=Actimicrobium sp. GrIS 1.19 TaxID=3071708 RepID=UPI002DFE42F2|nr:hypothetical protein [Actimicrobium sp. GrIS 1.19]
MINSTYNNMDYRNYAGSSYGSGGLSYGATQAQSDWRFGQPDQGQWGGNPSQGSGSFGDKSSSDMGSMMNMIMQLLSMLFGMLSNGSGGGYGSSGGDSGSGGGGYGIGGNPYRFGGGFGDMASFGGDNTVE